MVKQKIEIKLKKFKNQKNFKKPFLISLVFKIGKLIVK